MWPFNKARSEPLSLERALEVFASYGVPLRPGITVENLLISHERKTFEKDFRLLAICLGGDVEEEPFPRISDRLWHFDTECIEDHGAYVTIAERMRDLAAPYLQMTDIKDYVDLEEGRAALSFLVGTDQVNWNLTIDDDWVDPVVLSNFVDLLKKQTASFRYTYMDLGGQDCLIGFANDEQRKKLNSELGLNFVWLK